MHKICANYIAHCMTEWIAVCTADGIPKILMYSQIYKWYIWIVVYEASGNIIDNKSQERCKGTTKAA